MDTKPIEASVQSSASELQSPTAESSQCKLLIPENEIEGETLSQLLHDPFFKGCDQVIVEAPNGTKRPFSPHLQVKSPNPRQILFSFGEPSRVMEEVVQIINPRKK